MIYLIYLSDLDNDLSDLYLSKRCASIILVFFLASSNGTLKPAL